MKHYICMYSFWDREREFLKAKRFIHKTGFGYVTGRRRIGKSAFLTKLCREEGGLYHQAVEGEPQQQLLHLAEEWKESLPLFREIKPKTWSEFFALLSKENLPKILIFDEFPYWVESDPTLPSFLQKWIDHELPKKKTFIWMSGSSQSMLHSQFLNQGSPLYGRATAHIHLEPMPFHWFCKALDYPLHDPVSFERYCLVGGVPYYWKLMPSGSVIDQAHTLYFEPTAILSEEPKHLIQDEGITGTIPKAILDLIGRGVSKPSELGARIGTAQGNLSRPLALLLDVNLISKELPFGESSRTTKRVLYTLQDPALSFYYGTYLPFRERWNKITPPEKKNLLHLHASKQWEIFCRQAYGGSRYWEEDVEIDLISLQKDGHKTLVAECKWSDLSKKEEKNLLEDLQYRFAKTKIAEKLAPIDFKIFSKKDLQEIAKTEASEKAVNGT
ncbi:MAG: ATP-binding protein [Chlamydiae bacterium]|nr:ATP-binding protein [Chlamydiota bacterium]MBI3266265.1 ATP-binding protein [Chlamydiota bacterium]